MNSIREMNAPKVFKITGVYLIILLAFVRFVVYPLRDTIAEKKIVFSELHEMYRLKKQHFSRQVADEGKKAVTPLVSKDQITSYLYDKGRSFPSIQADILEDIIAIAEKKKLTVQNFEMLDPVAGKTISEVPVLIRMSGKPGDLIDVLVTITSGRRSFHIRSMELNRGNQDILLALTVIALRMEK